ncbi:LuxR C-terminal-related transcriptional regulator [Nocardia sp. GCM10030253]|uniref:helix-turn-helix transcriptional regulator n=1 Tax=Nocardia sp. GCM10030253 TaxID=3273404 RepID=UPI003627BAF9
MSLVQAPTSEFVGRQMELDRLGSLLSGGARLITLVGPGGIGKTRLAAEFVRRVHRARNRLVYWASLAELEGDCRATAQDVVQSAVCTFGTGGDYSADRAVLVLDNCEHLLGAVGPLIADLLAAAPGLTILATSREPIGWVDEYILTVPPLAPEQSLELLRQRAELVGRVIPDDAQHLAVAARICRRVDHNPLFIRLAAARLRHQPPAMVLRELTGGADDKRLRWTHGARSGTEARHRCVYDVLAWSFALCGVREQLLLERLSVFAAGHETDDGESPSRGIELDAVIAVCADHILPAGEIEHLLERLTERSLLSVHLTATTMNWYLVESVQVFARDRLHHRDRAEAELLSARHRRYFRDKFAAGQPMWHGPADRAWIDSVGQEIRSAVEVSRPLPAARSALSPSPWSDLSQAERDVAVFAAAGWPNSAIATRRHSSIRTVDAQVATIRQKLMIASRHEIARYIPDELAERVRHESERRPRRNSRVARYR